MTIQGPKRHPFLSRETALYVITRVRASLHPTLSPYVVEQLRKAVKKDRESQTTIKTPFWLRKSKE